MVNVLAWYVPELFGAEHASVWHVQLWLIPGTSQDAIIAKLRAGGFSMEDAGRAFVHLTAMYEHAVTFERSLDAQFAFGLELVLDGLERLRTG